MCRDKITEECITKISFRDNGIKDVWAPIAFVEEIVFDDIKIYGCFKIGKHENNELWISFEPCDCCGRSGVSFKKEKQEQIEALILKRYKESLAR